MSYLGIDSESIYVKAYQRIAHQHMMTPTINEVHSIHACPISSEKRSKPLDKIMLILVNHPPITSRMVSLNSELKPRISMLSLHE